MSPARSRLYAAAASSLSRRYSTAASSLLARRLPSIRDWISPTPTHLLSLSLSPYLRKSPSEAVNRFSPPLSGAIPPGHYLIYFAAQLPEEQLLFDGSDAEQSPGGEWVRRMWAGGSVDFVQPRGLQIFDRALLTERVESAEMKGEDKMFVWFERKMFSREMEMGRGERGRTLEMEDVVGAEPAAVERRCLVFMKARADKQAPVRVLKPQYTPEFSREFVPTAHLLFRFSALTFNAHKIHFDSEFSRQREGYPGNLCHGPLAQVFLLELLQREVLDHAPKKRVAKFEYRCLAPMYVDEKYRIAGLRTEENKVQLWAETPQGGYSVKGVATLKDVA